MSPQKLILSLLCAALSLAAQEPRKIRFAKDKTYIYFFQTGKKCDSVIAGATDVFYFLVPDSLKKYIVLSSENASFVPQKNDSLVICKYAYGIKYESYFSAVENDASATYLPKPSGVKERKEAEYRLKFGPNGSSSTNAGSILVQIIDTRTNTILLENTFKAIW